MSNVKSKIGIHIIDIDPENQIESISRKESQMISGGTLYVFDNDLIAVDDGDYLSIIGLKGYDSKAFISTLRDIGVTPTFL